jgi:hypothetical protein
VLSEIFFFFLYFQLKKNCSASFIAFRGSHEVFGSNNNGNYLGILELLARYDPFLREHITRYANKESGNAFYLSKDNEMLHLMKKKNTGNYYRAN